MFNFALFFNTMLILGIALISPGPDFFVVLRSSLNAGKRAGVLSALGIACGLLISFSLVVFGLEILFRYPLFKIILSLICGSYLIYLGTLSIKSKAKHTEIEKDHNENLPLFFYFNSGFVTNLFNPKLYSLCTAIMAGVEKFHPSIATNIMIIVGQSIMAFVWFTAVAVIFSQPLMQKMYFHQENIINKILGVVFILVGAGIILG